MPGHPAPWLRVPSITQTTFGPGTCSVAQRDKLVEQLGIKHISKSQVSQMAKVLDEQVEAIGAALPGAVWQRCRIHYLRNLLTTVPKSAQPWVAILVRTIFDRPTTDAVRTQHAWVIDALEAKYPAACEHLDAARDDLLAFAAFPRETWRQIWSDNPQERLNKEIRRRTDVVGIFPDRAAIIRLVGAVPAEQTDEWTEARRYMGLDILAKARVQLITGDTPTQNPLPQTLTA
jgi:transposase-like protein